MNQKITVRTHKGDVRYFIIDPTQNIPEQLAKVHNSSVGHGITYEMTETQIQTIDYFCGEVMFGHEIISVEETDTPVSLQWTIVTD